MLSLYGEARRLEVSLRLNSHATHCLLCDLPSIDPINTTGERYISERHQSCAAGQQALPDVALSVDIDRACCPTGLPQQMRRTDINDIDSVASLEEGPLAAGTASMEKPQPNSAVCDDITTKLNTLGHSQKQPSTPRHSLPEIFLPWTTTCQRLPTQTDLDVWKDANIY